MPYTDPSRTILDAARARAASGDTQGAAALLRDELLQHPDMLPLHDEYRHWLGQNGDKTELAKHGKEYISMLLSRDQDRRAIEIARECQIADPGFALDKTEDITRLAHAAADAGQTQVAMGLIGGLPQTLPQSSGYRPKLFAGGQAMGRAHEQASAGARAA